MCEHVIGILDSKNYIKNTQKFPRFYITLFFCIYLYFKIKKL